MLVTLSLLTIIVFFFVSSWIWRRFKKKQQCNAPPYYPGYLPVIGHAYKFVGDTVHLWSVMKGVLDFCLEKDTVRIIALGNWKFYLLTDPEDCHKVANACLEKDVIYDVAKPWLGEGLLTGSVPIWKRHRKLLNPSFSQHVLDQYLTVFNAQSRQLTESLEKEVGKGFNHAVYMEKCALEIICLTAMGIGDDDKLLKNSNYMDAVNEMCCIIAERIQNAWMQNNFLYSFTTLKKRQDYLIKIMHDMSNKIIQKRKEVILDPKHNEKNFESNAKRFKSFLNLVLESSVDGSLTDQEIQEEVDTIIVAGYDTSATLLTIALVLIGSHKEIEQKIYDELQAVFEGSNRDVDKHDLPKLVYLEAVIKEVLRLYPVGPIIGRRLTQDVQIRDYTLSAGQSCVISIYSMHRHKVWGPDRMTFRPERWLEPSTLPDLSSAFVGFGVGRRSCIGQKFGLMSMKTTLCHLLRRYKVHADHTMMVLKLDVMLKPYSGHHIRIENR